MSVLAAPSAARLEPRGEGRFTLSGQISFDNAATLLADGLRSFAGHGSVVVDLAGVTHSDSAGVALLLDWIATARRGGRELRYAAIPEQVLAIARLSGVDEFLPTA